MRVTVAAILLALLAGAVLAQTLGDVQSLKVQGNVYLITGAGANIAVQTGSQGVLVVDTGEAAMSDKVLAAIRKISDKPIQYIINTNSSADHAGGNEAIRKAGLTYVGANVTGNLTDAGVGAQIYAQDNVLQRMSAPSGVRSPIPFDAWPTETYLKGRKQLFFNGEPVEIIHHPGASTDGDSLVVFRRSDVVVTGDIFLTTSYPPIDLARGGGIQGEIDALNNLMEIAVPGLQDEGGTYLIPGHGHICDQPDLLEYRDMVTIIRDRIRAAIQKGMTLEQVRASGLTKDYDGRYGAKSGPGSAEMFVDAIYQGLAR